jgi:hypothetical protein
MVMIKLEFPSTRVRQKYRYQHTYPHTPVNTSPEKPPVDLRTFNEALGAATAGDDTPTTVPKEYPVTVVNGDEDSAMDTLQNDPGFGDQTVREQAQEVIRSTKLGISSIEYRRRKRLVREAYQKCTLQTGDTCFPTHLADRNTYGKMIVVGVLKDFDEYGDAEWNENPLIVSASPMNDRNITINCSYNWLIATSGGRHGVC